MTEQTKALGNAQACRKVFSPTIGRGEWAALSKEDKQELGDMAREYLAKQEDKAA